MSGITLEQMEALFDKKITPLKEAISSIKEELTPLKEAITSIQSWLLKRQIYFLKLGVEKSNVAALKLYQKCNFQIHQKKQQHYIMINKIFLSISAPIISAFIK